MKILFSLLFLNCLAVSYAQTFLPAFDRFSKKEITYITLKDGTKLEGKLTDLDRKKGLIEEVSIITADNKEYKLVPEQIKEMYLHTTGFEQFNKIDDAMFNVKTYSGEIDLGHIDKGYAYFVSTVVNIKGKNVTLLMQVLNPSFSEKIRVYHDPLAQETMSAGVGGFTVAGGDDKSYYVETNGKPAFKIKKKDFEDLFNEIFATCPELIKKVGTKIIWTNFDYYVYECTTGVDPKTLKKKK